MFYDNIWTKMIEYRDIIFFIISMIVTFLVGWFCGKTMSKMTANQQKELGKYFIDLSKIAAGVYVFTSLPKPFLLILGLSFAALFLGVGLILLKGE